MKRKVGDAPAGPKKAPRPSAGRKRKAADSIEGAEPAIHRTAGDKSGDRDGEVRRISVSRNIPIQSAGRAAPVESIDAFSHLGSFESDPFVISDAYFREGLSKQDPLVRHQLESYNYFIQFQLQQMVEGLNPIVCQSESELIKETYPHDLKYLTEVTVRLSNVRCQLPIMYEIDGSSKPMYPNEARLRNFTYGSNVTVQVDMEVVVRDENCVIVNTFKTRLHDIQLIADLPVMVKSCLCTLVQTPMAKVNDECKIDPGGYFIVKGSEKCVVGQERKAENRVCCFDASNTKHYLYSAEINSVPDGRCSAPKQTEVFVEKRNNGNGHPLTIAIPKLKQNSTVNLFVLFRALGVITDRDIVRYILLDMNTEYKSEAEPFLIASMHEARHIVTKEDAFNEIMSMVNYNNTMPYQFGKNMYGTDERTEEERRRDQAFSEMKKRAYTEELLTEGIFLHCRTHAQCVYYLGYIARRLIDAATGREQVTNRDSGAEKRVDTTGIAILNNVRAHAKRAIKDFQRHVCKEIRLGSWTSSGNYSSIITNVNIYQMLRPNTIRNGIWRALSTGDFSTKQASSKDGVAQLLNRVTIMGTISHLRKTITPTDKKCGEMLSPRKPDNSLYGMICQEDTPDSQLVGLVKSLSLMAVIPIASDSSPLYKLVEGWVICLDSPDMRPERAYRATKVFINGNWVGVIPRENIAAGRGAVQMYSAFKTMKQTGAISIHASVIFDVRLNEIRLGTGGGRMAWPLLRVRNGKVLLQKEHVAALASGELKWSDLLTNVRLKESVIEYLDAEETTFQYFTQKNYRETRTEVSSSEARLFQRHTYAEIHPLFAKGILAASIPFSEHNPATRNIYQTSMAKAAIGTYCTNYESRMDRSGFVLNFPSRKIIDSPVMASMGLDAYPSGETITLAVMCFDGYNQEDSQYLNAGSVERGMFLTTVYSTEKNEDKSVVRDEVVRCRPDPSYTRGIRKNDDYSKLNVHGVLNKNTEVVNSTVIMSKSMPINKATASGVNGDGIRMENFSVAYRGRERAFVQHNYVGRNGEGINVGKTTLRTLRPPMMGDKFSPENGQKGVAGFVSAEEDMPFTASGLRPDIIMNPHAFPSRMTFSQLQGTPIATAMMAAGFFADGSPFQKPIPFETIQQILNEHGFESHGYEVMYSGQTGEVIPVKIFTGPVFYQRLKHMVEDKVHSRDHGQMMMLTRQPGEGRSRAGGFKFGEMEVHVLWAHGCAEMMMDRMFHASDAFGVYVCRDCGMMAVGNNGRKKYKAMAKLDGFRVYNCRTCGNSANITYVHLPYACKLLFQELRTAGVVPRIITE